MRIQGLYRQVLLLLVQVFIMKLLSFLACLTKTVLGVWSLMLMSKNTCTAHIGSQKMSKVLLGALLLKFKVSGILSATAEQLTQ